MKLMGMEIPGSGKGKTKRLSVKTLFPSNSKKKKKNKRN
jgi:hypothetical protein